MDFYTSKTTFQMLSEIGFNLNSDRIKRLNLKYLYSLR